MVTAKVKVGNALLEVQAANPKELFRRLAGYSDLFSERACGCCGKGNLVHEHRQTGDGGQYSYFSIRCLDCSAQLDYGQNKDNVRLFAKRGGEHAKTRGWYVYQGGDGSEQRHPADEPQRHPTSNGDDIPF